jgi:Asp-tRNA(Asn)/Glu-tRNA(Gln) amidotransferase A subunit family amidase
VGTTKDNLSLGSFWAARRYDEKSLIRVTYALEQILNARQNPLAHLN